MRRLRRGLPLAALLAAAALAGPAAPGGSLPYAADRVAADGDGREMVSLALPFTPAPLQAMAMADASGRIEEVRLQPAATPRGETEAGCRTRLRGFAAGLLPAEGSIETLRHPGFREFRLPLQGATALGRWFPAGGSCDLALVFASAQALPRR